MTISLPIYFCSRKDTGDSDFSNTAYSKSQVKRKIKTWVKIASSLAPPLGWVSGPSREQINVSHKNSELTPDCNRRMPGVTFLQPLSLDFWVQQQNPKSKSSVELCWEMRQKLSSIGISSSLCVGSH